MSQTNERAKKEDLKTTHNFPIVITNKKSTAKSRSCLHMQTLPLYYSRNKKKTLYEESDHIAIMGKTCIACIRNMAIKIIDSLHTTNCNSRSVVISLILI